eukprot:7804839-Alexandrium_andersonii.AAC.1
MPQAAARFNLALGLGMLVVELCEQASRANWPADRAHQCARFSSGGQKHSEPFDATPRPRPVAVRMLAVFASLVGGEQAPCRRHLTARARNDAMPATQSHDTNLDCCDQACPQTK